MFYVMLTTPAMILRIKPGIPFGSEKLRFGPFDTEARAEQFVQNAQPRIAEYHRGVASERHTLMGHLKHLERG